MLAIIFLLLALQLYKEITNALLSDSNNKMALITFATTSSIITGFTNNKEAMLGYLDSLSAIGSTNYNSGLLNADEVEGPLLGTNFVSDGIADYVADSKDKYLVGGAGSFYYKFKAVKVANEAKTLKFSYQRTWENNTNNLPDAIVKITVS